MITSPVASVNFGVFDVGHWTLSVQGFAVRMPFAVIDDEALDPIAVSLLGPNAVVFSPDDFSNLIEQLRLVPG